MTSLFFKNAKIHTITKGILEKGQLLAENGKISAIGQKIKVPKTAEVIDLKGCWLMPGLIDCHTHICNFPEPVAGASHEYDGNEMSDPVTPQVRARDAINPFDAAVRKAREAGFTTVATLPGSGNLIGGEGIAMKLRGRSADEMIIPGTEMLKMALGENPKRNYGERNILMTRMGNAARMREMLFKGQEYARRKANAEKKGEFFEKNFQMETLQKALRGECRVRIHAHRADDILTAVQVAEEFGLDYSIEHCTEGWKIKDILAGKGHFCVVGPMTMEPYKKEIWALRLENAGELAQAGVPICLTADTSSHTCYLPIHVGVQMAYGLDEQTAFEAVTINPAKLLKIDDRTGSLEVGKDADLAVFTGHPFLNTSRCRMTVIDGRIYLRQPADSMLRVDTRPEELSLEG